MKIVVFLLSIISISPLLATSPSDLIKVPKFSRIIISPHIQANLAEGDHESVEIKNSQISRDKINIKVEGNTLRIYLEDAKVFTRSKKVKGDKWNSKQSVYQGTMVTVNITYRNLISLSVRGEEDITCVSPIQQETFQLKIYGEPNVFLQSLLLDDFKVTIFGEGQLDIGSGAVRRQSYVAYGESKVKATAMKNNFTRVRAYGESDFRIYVSDLLRVSAFGEAHITYQGNANVERGLVIGEARIIKSEPGL